MKSTFSSGRGLLAFLAGPMIWFVASVAEARIDLSVLQQQGYGVELKRPQPNTLAVEAKINGHPALLVVDTGWSGHGITLDRESAGSLKSPMTDNTSHPETLSGKSLTGLKNGVADTVSLGNVEIDLHNLRLYLRPPGTGHRAVLGPGLCGAGLAEIPFSITGSSLAVVNAEINGATGAMIVDTGKVLTGVDSRLASKMKVAGYSSRVGTIDAAGALTRTELAKIQSFKIGGVNLRAPDVRLEQFPIYTQTNGRLIGFLGIDILGPNGAIIDYGNLKLYCYPL